MLYAVCLRDAVIGVMVKESLYVGDPTKSSKYHPYPLATLRKNSWFLSSSNKCSTTCFEGA